MLGSFPCHLMHIPHPKLSLRKSDRNTAHPSNYLVNLRVDLIVVVVCVEES